MTSELKPDPNAVAMGLVGVAFIVFAVGFVGFYRHHWIGALVFTLIGVCFLIAGW